MSMQRIPRTLVAGVISLSLLAAACGDDDDSAATTAAPTTAAAPMTEAPMAPDTSEEMTQDTPDIVDTAAAAGDFSTLVAAVQAAGLEETLRGPGPFTVFAPTDEAFAEALAALGMTAEELLADTELLTAVLTYHVVAGNVMAADAIALDGQDATTVNGAPLAITVVDGKVMLNGDTTVVSTDIVASNGVIHVIDKVLLPPT